MAIGFGTYGRDMDLRMVFTSVTPLVVILDSIKWIKTWIMVRPQILWSLSWIALACFFQTVHFLVQLHSRCGIK